MKQLLADLDALLVTDPINIYYLTGFIGLAPEEREGYALVYRDQIYLFVNPLYEEKSKKLTTDNPQLTTILISREQPLTEKIKKVLDSLTLARTIKLGFEAEDITYQEYQTFKEKLCLSIRHSGKFGFAGRVQNPDSGVLAKAPQNDIIQLIPTRNRIEELRQIKRPDEIANIRAACKLGDECFEYIVKQLKVGVTEAEIAAEIEYFFKKRGADIAFSPIVAFNANASQPHYSSSSRFTLNASSLVLLDFGAKVNGYHGDMTRMVFFGEPKEEWKRAYLALKNAQQHALDLLKTDERSGAKLDQTVRDQLAKQGYPPYPHSLGHSVGLAIHEAPRLSVKHDEILKPSMVFSIEPGIYVEGKYGVRIEDLVTLTENGVEILTQSPKNLVMI